jgi:Calcineurin-like phosphoesterase
MAVSTDSCPDRPKRDGLLVPEAWRASRRGVVYRPDDQVESEFPPEPMVRWLSPTGLASSAFRVLLAGIFGLYSDKRELEAVLRDPGVDDYSKRDELWVDYVADLADGWNPTYAVASILARPKLELDGNVAQRGDVLVMGGDQVYPFATEGTYSRRFLAPYQAALPCTEQAEPPRLYAIPGNHDWYDGLTTFMRLFCRRQWIGGWRTEQKRSYFALRLPGGWWLWGLDIQFDFYIDEPQLQFFQGLVGERKKDDENKVILCTARPSWVHERLEGDLKAQRAAKRNLEYFERHIIRKHGWRLVVAISGDHHHYARYDTTEGPQQKITCGGGGAFLYPTHGLPDTLDWPEDDAGREKTYARATVYPAAEDSKRLRARALLVPFHNPSFWALMGVVHLLLAWMIRFGLGAAPAGGPQGVRGAGFVDLVVGLVRNPVGLIFAIVLILALGTFAGMGGWKRGRWPVGLVHALIQITAVIALIWAFAAPFDDLAVVAFLPIFLALLGVVGGLVGSLLMGLYLWLSQQAGKHSNEAFSSAHIQDYKSFLRLRVSSDGSLEVFPIALDRVPRKWQAVPKGDPQDPWFKPVDGEVTPRLIEPPIPVEVRR